PFLGVAAILDAAAHVRVDLAARLFLGCLILLVPLTGDLHSIGVESAAGGGDAYGMLDGLAVVVQDVFPAAFLGPIDAAWSVIEPVALEAGDRRVLKALAPGAVRTASAARGHAVVLGRGRCRCRGGGRDGLGSRGRSHGCGRRRCAAAPALRACCCIGHVTCPTESL